MYKNIIFDLGGVVVDFAAGFFDGSFFEQERRR